ncbi:MAG: CBS domain-containing protein [Candidatus Micrarchaeota archaeon]|nr:CBS domain-containing protein [Candidatus Micrarchaeota archaeon]
MDVKKPVIIDIKEPVSKILDRMIETGMPAVVTEDSKYIGIVDDKNLAFGRMTKQPATLHAGAVMIKAPKIEIADMDNIELILKKFLAGHFKALAVVDAKGSVHGLITRSDLITSLLEKKMIPNISVSAVMATPVYTIDIRETVSTVKKLMKELDARRLVVVENGKVRGVISTFDFLPLMERTNTSRDSQFKKSVIGEDNIGISQLMREASVFVNKEDMLPLVASEIARHNTSYAVAVNSSNNPIGVIPSIDLLKLVSKMITKEPSVFISGLHGEDLFYYEDAKLMFSRLLNKFGKSFDIDHMDIKVKKGKSVYMIHLRVGINSQTVNIKAEAYNLVEGFNILETEFSNLIRKWQSKQKNKKSRAQIEILEEGEYI